MPLIAMVTLKNFVFFKRKLFPKEFNFIQLTSLSIFGYLHSSLAEARSTTRSHYTHMGTFTIIFLTGRLNCRKKVEKGLSEQSKSSNSFYKLFVIIFLA